MSEQSMGGTDQSSRWNESFPQAHSPPVPTARSSPSGQIRTLYSIPKSHTPSVSGNSSRLTISLPVRVSRRISIVPIYDDGFVNTIHDIIDSQWDRSVDTATDHEGGDERVE